MTVGAVASALLAMHVPGPPGSLGPHLESALEGCFILRQASGMVAAQTDSNVDDAVVRLRAHAFANGLDTGVVADDVITRRLRFDRHGIPLVDVWDVEPSRPRGADGQRQP